MKDTTAACGFQCRECPEYPVRCVGCRGECPRDEYTELCAIRACVKKRRLLHCGQCEEYICETLENMLRVSPGAKEQLERLRNDKGE
jgi:hypothetical protein